MHPGRLKGRVALRALARRRRRGAPGHEAPPCQRSAPARFGLPEPAVPDGWPQRAADGVRKPGQHGARRLQAEVGGLDQQLRAGLLADEPAARVHGSFSPAPNQVGLFSGWNKGRVGALACVPGATSIPEHDQSRAGVWRRVALRWRRGRAQAASGARQGVGLPPGAGAVSISAGARGGSRAAPSGRVARGSVAEEPLQRVQVNVAVEGRPPLLRQRSQQHARAAYPGLQVP